MRSNAYSSVSASFPEENISSSNKNFSKKRGYAI